MLAHSRLPYIVGVTLAVTRYFSTFPGSSTTSNHVTGGNAADHASLLPITSAMSHPVAGEAPRSTYCAAGVAKP